MALIKCPECHHDVSDAAMKCPQCGVQLRKAKRSFFGKILKFLLIAFNILMIIWLGSFWMQIGSTAGNGTSAEQVGTAIGATLVTGMLIKFWVCGAIILGILVLLTRPKNN